MVKAKDYSTGYCGVLADGHDKQEMDEAIDDIIRKVHVDTLHDVPYLAGYSYDCKTIYIDRHLPADKYDFKYLIMHETVEKSLMDELGVPYEFAHIVATAAERTLVESDGLNWKEYDKFMQKYVKTAEHEELQFLPDDLDITPYEGTMLGAMLKKMGV